MTRVGDDDYALSVPAPAADDVQDDIFQYLDLLKRQLATKRKMVESLRPGGLGNGETRKVAARLAEISLRRCHGLMP